MRHGIILLGAGEFASSLSQFGGKKFPSYLVLKFLQGEDEGGCGGSGHKKYHDGNSEAIATDVATLVTIHK